MNPTQLERIAAPVIVNTTEKGYAGYTPDPVSGLNNTGIQRLQHDIGDTNRDVKDAEAHILAKLGDARYENAKSEAEIRRDVVKAEADVARDVLKEGQDNLKATMDSECKLSKEILEAKFALTKEVLETKHSLAKDILKSEYENKLAIQAAIKEVNDKAQYNADRTQDKNAHYFEEITEKQNACCCENELANATQTGLLTQLVKSLIK